MEAPRRLIAVVGAVALLLAGCTDVPSSSAPDTIEALDTGGSNALPSVVPNLGAGRERDLVQAFLDANATTTGTHPTARAYLTPAASRTWHDDTATIVGNDYTISTYNAKKHTVTVFGRVLGTLNKFGIYTPFLQGSGDGGEKVPFVFHLAAVSPGAQRITKLGNGLLLSDAQFRDAYRQQALYFYDSTHSTLVPDVRWTALEDRADLADWLLTELVNGPRPELQTAVNADTLPPEADPRQISVQLGSPTKIEIPGSSQLDAATRNRLAAQLSQTLLQTLAGGEMAVTDGGAPVMIPALSSDHFSAADFGASTGPPSPTSEVYYLDGGAVRDDAGKPLAGPAGDGSVFLNACAVGQPRAGGPMYVAGVEGSGDQARLVVGSQRGALRDTGIRGRLSRPAFAPGRSEVWIGAGARVYRVLLDGGAPHPEQVPILTGGGQVLALRFSPEGSRLAVVISGAGGLTQLYVGAVVRGAGPPRVDSLKPISPEGVVVKDVAWLDSFKLFAIGYLAGSQDAKTYETGVDGTDWTNSSIGNLPAPPDSVTAATASSVWVSADGFVWKRVGSSWDSPGAAGQTPGTAPVYLE